MEPSIKEDVGPHADREVVGGSTIISCGREPRVWGTHAFQGEGTQYRLAVLLWEEGRQVQWGEPLWTRRSRLRRLQRFASHQLSVYKLVQAMQQHPALWTAQ